MVIPIKDESISAYWTLPTVDCTFSDTHTKLNVLMAVPLKKTGRDWSLHKFSAIPFHRQFNNVNYICYLSGIDEGEEYYKFDSNSNKTYKTDGDVTTGFLKYSPIEIPNFLKAFTPRDFQMLDEYSKDKSSYL